MKSSTLANLYAGIAAAAFLLATASGNAIAIFLVGATGFVAGLLIFGRKFAGLGTLVAVTSGLVAAVIAFALHHRS